jgi:UDP-N-acetyl-D-mannosaminuronate dehydrogenase
MNKDARNMKICVVGMGYVGLSLSMLLAKKYDVFGVDNSELKLQL